MHSVYTLFLISLSITNQNRLFTAHFFPFKRLFVEIFDLPPKEVFVKGTSTVNAEKQNISQILNP